MKVLRKKDLRKVGKRGEVVDVSDGYGANYIIPNGYGVLFTKQAQMDFAKEQAEEKRIHDEKVAKAKEVAEKRKTITLEFSASAGRNGDRIGTISFKKASEARKKQYSIALNKDRLIDKDVLVNGFGLTTLKVDLFDGVIAELRIHVSLKEGK